ncbi:IS481 family transposase [Gandjariella thermophila]|uniref:IS481 family transposase n=1 Tax=Gandjariella thermophila TaxID=1931992 RepID=A0A4D4JI45_9PSEU|nr:IS481 family transposase [Gandjariella thermophila]GDY33949.1 IS481 family transposase [Gandjariella thermophila]
MIHGNAPLTPAGRLRLVCRVQAGRPIAHVAAEAGIARQTLSKWVGRYRARGEDGLFDRRSTPRHSPRRTSREVVTRIEALRREHKYSARLIVHTLAAEGVTVSSATVGRWLTRLGLNRRGLLDPTGATNRRPRRITARYPGHMVHVDVKKIGRIPDGGGWRIHGRGSPGDRAARRQKVGYAYFHTALDGYSRLADTEALDNETADTAVGFLARARAFFRAHGITQLTRVITDNAPCYTSPRFARSLGGTRHQRIRAFTPRHNGKVERYHRILAHELCYARAWNSEDERHDALRRWLIHFNYHRPHTATGDQPPATRLHAGVSNVMIGHS